MIKGLLKKDLYNLASYKTTLIIVVLFCGIAIIGTDAIYWGSVVIGIIVGMISLSTFSYDEMSKSNKYILTLPVTRKEIVLEKYVLAIGATILGGILGFIVTLLVGNVMNYLRPDNLIDINIETLLATSVGGMFGISLIQSIQIPSIFKWGAEKGRIQMFMVLFVLVIIGAIAGFLLKQAGLSVDIEKLENILNNFGLVALILLSCLMYFISYKISYKIYKNKEE
ncbi:MAG TPA: ABC-2 transporter permease [Candidatus Faecimonas gallistercoris]|nr:ABC-2 transporter permease [Candidatus Faecimonas gallistercoris]